MAIAKRKKRFFDVEMPIIGKTTQLQAFEVKELGGRFIIYDLTRILRGKSVLLQLVVKVKDDKATSVPRELKVMPYFLKRAVRKGTDYIEDSFVTETKDSKILIKPFIVTRRRVSRVVRKALRSEARKELIEILKSKKINDLFDEILKNKLQKDLSLKLKKIYPLALCEIKSLKVLENKETTKKDEKETKKEKKEPEKLEDKKE